MELRRRLYSRGGSYETTIPKPLLFALDAKKRYNVLFSFDGERGRWYLDFEERDTKDDSGGGGRRREGRHKGEGRHKAWDGREEFVAGGKNVKGGKREWGGDTP